mgnify:CR=1 FL=1
MRPGETKPVAPNRRLQQRARRREAILRAATDVFYERGLQSATMDHVARRLGTSKVAIYRHFPTKESLVEAVLTRVVDRFVAAERRPWYGFESALRHSLTLAREDAPAYLLLMRVSENDPSLARYAAEWRALVYRTTEGRLALLDHLTDVDPLLRAAAIKGVVDFLFSAVSFWIEHGAAAQDEAWLSWVAQSGRAILGWRTDAPFTAPLPPVIPD